MPMTAVDGTLTGVFAILVKSDGRIVMLQLFTDLRKRIITIWSLWINYSMGIWKDIFLILAI